MNAVQWFPVRRSTRPLDSLWTSRPGQHASSTNRRLCCEFSYGKQRHNGTPFHFARPRRCACQNTLKWTAGSTTRFVGDRCSPSINGIVDRVHEGSSVRPPARTRDHHNQNGVFAPQTATYLPRRCDGGGQSGCHLGPRRAKEHFIAVIRPVSGCIVCDHGAATVISSRKENNGAGWRRYRGTR